MTRRPARLPTRCRAGAHVQRAREEQRRNDAAEAEGADTELALSTQPAKRIPPTDPRRGCGAGAGRIDRGGETGSTQADRRAGRRTLPGPGQPTRAALAAYEALAAGRARRAGTRGKQVRLPAWAGPGPDRAPPRVGVVGAQPAVADSEDALAVQDDAPLVRVQPAEGPAGPPPPRQRAEIPPSRADGPPGEGGRGGWGRRGGGPAREGRLRRNAGGPGSGSSGRPRPPSGAAAEAESDCPSRGASSSPPAPTRA
jgi:hypothetical protein